MCCYCSCSVACGCQTLITFTITLSDGDPSVVATVAVVAKLSFYPSKVCQTCIYPFSLTPIDSQHLHICSDFSFRAFVEIFSSEKIQECASLSLLGDNTCLLLCHVFQSSLLPSCFNLFVPSCVFFSYGFIIVLDSTGHSHTICIQIEDSRNAVKVLVRNSVCNCNRFIVSMSMIVMMRSCVFENFTGP